MYIDFGISRFQHPMQIIIDKFQAMKLLTGITMGFSKLE